MMVEAKVERVGRGDELGELPQGELPAASVSFIDAL